MASALVAKRAGLGELTDDFVLSPEVQALMKRVTVQPDDRKDPDDPGRSPYDLVIVETSDKNRLESAKVKDIRGGAKLPLKREELWTKFEGCLATSPRPFAARDLFDALMSLDTISHVNDLPGLGGEQSKRAEAGARTATSAATVQ